MAGFDHPPDPRRWKALSVTLVAGFMGLLDVSIVTVAVPSIQRGLGITTSGIQWVVSGYALTFGLVLVTGGRLGDILGRRRMFLGALAGFVLTSALAGAAVSEPMIVAARLLQGVAAGALTPQNSGLIQELFRGAERGKAFGAFGAVVGLSTAVGPVLGGLIIRVFGEQDGWRWVFFVNVPIGVAAFVLALRLVPRGGGRPARVRSEIDVVGVVLLGLAALCVLLPLVQAEQGWLRSRWWLLPLALVFGALFVRWEQHRTARERPPLLDTRLLRTTPGYATGVAIGGFFFCGFAGIWLVFALFFQYGLGYSPLGSGLSVTPFALGSAVSSALAGRAIHRLGRRVTVVGLGVFATGLLGVSIVALIVPAQAVGWAVAGPLLLGGIGAGMVISPNITLTLERVPTRMAGAAGAALQTSQRIGAALGIALLASVFHAVVTAAGGGYAHGLVAALLCATGFTMIALGFAGAELRARRARATGTRTEYLPSPDA